MSIEWIRAMHLRHSEDMTSVSEDAIVLSVNGKACVGRCGGCAKPITVEDMYSQARDVPGALICGECMEENEAHFREMRREEK
jgi:hypothetical protein